MLDKLDMQILCLLKSNGRISFSNIARNLETSTTTIKHRIKILFDSHIFEYSLQLDYSFLDAKEILLLFTTNELKENIISLLNFKTIIKSMIKITDGRYLARVIFCSIDDFSKMNHLFHQNNRVGPVYYYPIKQKPNQSIKLTQLMQEVLKLLCTKPRVSIRTIASTLGRSTKGVRNAVQRLVESGFIRSSINCYHPMLGFLVKCDETIIDTPSLEKWCKKKFSCFWQLDSTSVDSSNFIFFIPIHIDDIIQILKEIMRKEGVIVLDSFFAEPQEYWNIDMNEVFAKLRKESS